ncbi:MAG: PAS domain-containing protein [Polyangiaceae bacterium]
MRPNPTGVERTFEDEEIIVSKTDLRGQITYANEVFVRVSGYLEDELIGKPHSILRHPAMPRCVFKLLWDTLEARSEVFAYVLNLAKNGDHYWVLAHVTPTFGADGQPIGYHSSRRKPENGTVDKIVPLYERLLAEEQRQPTKWQEIDASTTLLTAALAEAGVAYDEFVFSLASPASG